MLTNKIRHEMIVIDKLFAHRRQEKQVIWGIRVSEKVKARWLVLAGLMRVPCNRLILFVLQDWAKANAETLLDREARNQLAHRITELYLKRNLS